MQLPSLHELEVVAVPLVAAVVTIAIVSTVAPTPGLKFAYSSSNCLNTLLHSIFTAKLCFYFSESDLYQECMQICLQARS